MGLKRCSKFTRANGITSLQAQIKRWIEGAFDRQGGWDEFASIAGAGSLVQLVNEFTSHGILRRLAHRRLHSNSRFVPSFFSDSTGTDVVLV